MIYHRHSMVGYMLGVRFALPTGRPLRALEDVYAEHLESLGTKASTVPDVVQMLTGFSSLQTRIQLSFGDLLEGVVGQRHQGWLLKTAKQIYPRELVKRHLSKSDWSFSLTQQNSF